MAAQVLGTNQPMNMLKPPSGLLSFTLDFTSLQICLESVVSQVNAQTMMLEKLSNAANDTQVSLTKIATEVAALKQDNNVRADEVRQTTASTTDKVGAMERKLKQQQIDVDTCISHAADLSAKLKTLEHTVKASPKKTSGGGGRSPEFFDQVESTIVQHANQIRSLEDAIDAKGLAIEKQHHEMESIHEQVKNSVQAHDRISNDLSVIHGNFRDLETQSKQMEQDMKSLNLDIKKTSVATQNLEQRKASKEELERHKAVLVASLNKLDRDVNQRITSEVRGVPVVRMASKPPANNNSNNLSTSLDSSAISKGSEVEPTQQEVLDSSIVSDHEDHDRLLADTIYRAISNEFDSNGQRVGPPQKGSIEPSTQMTLERRITGEGFDAANRRRDYMHPRRPLTKLSERRSRGSTEFVSMSPNQNRKGQKQRPQSAHPLSTTK